MIQFLVTAVIVVICVFLLVLLLSLMVWVISWAWRILFPSKFSGVPVKKEKKKKKAKEVVGERMEDRCLNCVNFGKCPLASRDVVYPCKFYGEQPGEQEK